MVGLPVAVRAHEVVEVREPLRERVAQQPEHDDGAARQGVLDAIFAALAQPAHLPQEDVRRQVREGDDGVRPPRDLGGGLGELGEVEVLRRLGARHAPPRREAHQVVGDGRARRLGRVHEVVHRVLGRREDGRARRRRLVVVRHLARLGLLRPDWRHRPAERVDALARRGGLVLRLLGTGRLLRRARRLRNGCPQAAVALGEREELVARERDEEVLARVLLEDAPRDALIE